MRVHSYMRCGTKNSDKFTVFRVISLWIAAVCTMKTFRQFVADSIAVTWRKNLTHHVQRNYLDHKIYYKINTLHKIVDNPDQRITQDISKFSTLSATILTKLFSSPITVFYYTYTVFQTIGWQGPLACYGYFLLGSIINKFLISPIVTLWFKQEALEGNFRFSHVSLRTNAESVAFYDGENKEREINEKFFGEIITNRWKIAFRTFFLNYHMNLFGYIGAILNYLLIAFAIFVSNTFIKADDTPGSIAQRISISSFNILMLVYGFTEFIQLGSELGELAGHVSRLGDMQEAIDTVNKMQKLETENNTEESDIIEFENVSIYTPSFNSKCLVRNLNFRVEPGKHTLIVGPSGSGKSSILRVLCDLWQHKEGIVRKPSKQDIFYIPQQVYTNLGSLKDQIIYPDSNCESEERLYYALQNARLGHLYQRVGQDWNFCCNWAELLSPGERQRLALSRLFYRQPKFAILDESTSALDIDVEEEIYENMKQLGITLISVGHRPTLKSFHDYYLRLDGLSGYTEEKIQHEENKTK
jgi:ATP-binding cassette subfamily D (ALD) protein 4